MRIHDRALTYRRFRRACLLIALAISGSLAFCLDPQKDLRQFGHRSWQTDSGLPQNTVHAVLQSKDGYIWLATEGGLVRFDGVQFAVYGKEAPAHLRSTSINTLFEDGNGDLWIGTEDGLVRRHGDVFTSFTTANGLPSNTIWSVFQSRAGQSRVGQSRVGQSRVGKNKGGQGESGESDGALWIVTPEGLARYRNGSFESFPIAAGISNPKSVVEATDGSFWIGTHAGLEHFQDGRIDNVAMLANVDVQAVAAAADGRVWAGSRAGLSSFAPGNAAANLPLSGLPSSDITSLTTGRNGDLWIGTAKGAALLQAGAVTTYTARDGLPADSVDSIFEDRDGAIWIATSRGLARVVDGHAQAFGAGEGLFSGVVLSIFEDREGSLWLGTESGGLEMLHDQKFSSYTTADGLTDDLIRSIAQARDGTVWIGTNGGGLNRYEHGKFTGVTTANGLSSDIVLALASDAAGNLWVGTPDGLDRLRDGRITASTSADGLADDFVRSIYAASDGSLWIGTRRGLSHLQNGRFTNYSSLDGLGSDLVGAILEDSAHRLWIGTLGGLTRFDHGKFTTLTTRDGLASNVVTALYADHEGDLWIGTNQGGLNLLRFDSRDDLRGKKIVAFPPDRTGLPESVYAILEDARGNLWLSSKTGIDSVSKRELNDFAEQRSASIDVTGYGTADGMKIGEGSSGGHPAAWKLADGTMWFATLRGIASVDPEDLAKNKIPPPVTIEDVLIDDQPVATDAALTVPPGHSRFEFHYAGLSFVSPQKVRFRYKLDGFDRGWVDAGTRRTAYYTNLPPGKYRFRVLACNNDGVWNDAGALVAFRLQPHYYQTYWFYLLLLLGLGLLIYQIYRWRLQQVELRYAAVLAERGRIAREIHDTLAQGLVGISVQLELVNRLLASSVETARAQLDQARGLVRDSIAEARSSIWDLRSQAAEQEDLATRLSQMAATATERSMPKIKVQSKISGTYRPLAPKAEAELLKIAQEAVANAVRHAKPEHIAIELRFGAGDLQMTIQDDGCGFDGQPHPQSSGPNGHFGLTGMRERAEEIGATLLVDSSPGKGTQVSVHLAIAG